MRLSCCALFVAAAGLSYGAQPSEPNLPILRAIVAPDGLYGVSFSADGRTLLTCSMKMSDDNGRFLTPPNEVPRLWDVATGKRRTGFDPARGVAQLGKKGILEGTYEMSPDARIVAATLNLHDPGDHSYILLLDVGSGDLLRGLDYGNVRPIGIHFSPDGATLAIGGDDGHVRIWDVASGKPRREFPMDKSDLGKRGYAFYVGAFSPDGKTIAASCEDGSIRLFDADSGKEKGRLEKPVGPPPAHGWHQFAFSPDGFLLATAGDAWDPSVRVWNVADRKVVCASPLVPPSVLPPGKRSETWDLPQPPYAYTLDFSPDGKTLLVWCTDNKVRLYEAATAELRHEIDFVEIRPATVRASPVGSLLALGHEQGKLYLADWHATDRKPIRPIGLGQKERLWQDLAADDAVVAWRAVTRLIASPDEATALLSERLRPVEPPSTGEVERLVGQLDDNDYDKREEANRRLEGLAEQAAGPLRRALAHDPSPELSRRAEGLLARLYVPPDAEKLRRMRAVEVLEAVGGPEAKRLLHKLAAGAAGAVLTEDARAALHRLETVRPVIPGKEDH